MSKSRNGDGSVTQRKDGRWMVRTTDPATGRRVTRYATDEDGAKRVLRNMQSRADAREPVLDVSASVRSYAGAWLNDRAGRRREASTVREYRRRLEDYVLPQIGGIKVSALTMLDVEDVLDTLAKSGKSEATIRGTRNALAAMLSDAVRAQKLKVNVAAQARLPEKVVKPAARVVPTPEQVVALLDATTGTDLGALVSLLAGTGARVGEGLAAKWVNLDLEACNWSIEQTVTRDLAGSAVLGSTTKTKESREVALPADVVDALRTQRKRVAVQRLKAGDAWADLDLVFPTSIGTVRDPHNVRRELRKTAPTFPGSFHGLRHAFATAAVSLFPSDAAVAKVLGHRRRATTTDLYGHLRSDDSRAVAEVVSAQLREVRERASR